MERYRAHILGSKKKMGSARGLIHYKTFIAQYLAAKRVVVAQNAAMDEMVKLSQEMGGYETEETAHQKPHR